MRRGDDVGKRAARSQSERKCQKVCAPRGDTHLASGPLLLARWPSIFSTTVTLPLLAASSSSWSLPMVHLHRDRAAALACTLVNLCFHYDYSRFIDPAWPSCGPTGAPLLGRLARPGWPYVRTVVRVVALNTRRRRVARARARRRYVHCGLMNGACERDGAREEPTAPISSTSFPRRERAPWSCSQRVYTDAECQLDSCCAAVSSIRFLRRDENAGARLSDNNSDGSVCN